VTCCLHSAWSLQGTLDAFRRIPVEEGIGGYFRGLGPSVSRAAVINGCGIASYDHTKQIVLQLTGQSEGLTSQVRARVELMLI
jgi:hypothetical protein